ncbi:recombinase family protein [Sulfurivermis fontis]|uniref:recombinase family protein n=1 Tax=Sulfurivermis fontis TaxID=1972068 RepID=UPI000FDB903D|nr:recombinase family protein [Sulfurivermis fontis]
MARVALYARVSTNKDQTVETQLLALRDWAAGRGHTVVAEFTDEGISGAKGRDKRPGLDAMMKAAALGKFDMVAVVELSRLGRSLSHLVQIGTELQALGVDLFLHRQALDSSTPFGRMQFGMLGVLAEYERDLIRERTLEGLARAKKRGKRLGRPTVSPGKEQKIAALLKAGTPINRIRRITQVGVSAIYRIKKEMEECPPTTN